MKNSKWFLRILVGLLFLTVILVVGFSLSLSVLHTWGSTDEDIYQSYPGDELIDTPLIFWHQTEMIDAPIEEVWPWIAQLGDTQGAFYSYMFIENLMVGERLYQNADVIHPTWQNPQPGTQLIGGAMEVYQVEPGRWLLGNSTNEIGWTWLWYLESISEKQTHLIIRTRIQPPTDMGENAVLGFFMDAGGLVMAKNMLQGIQVRAEGGFEPVWIEGLEIAVWLICFLLGLIFGIRFIRKGGWIFLGFALLSVIALIWFTFFQPIVVVRLVVDVVLAACWIRFGKKE